jgi:hypothetical protein
MPRQAGSRLSCQTLGLMKAPLPYQREVLDFLEDLRDLNPRLGPCELIALWFDALYFPAQTYVSVEGQAEWAACFSSEELSALAEFNAVFDPFVDRLPRTAGWEQDDGWQRISRAASDALKKVRHEV